MCYWADLGSNNQVVGVERYLLVRVELPEEREGREGQEGREEGERGDRKGKGLARPKEAPAC